MRAELCDHQLVAEWRDEACFTPSLQDAASSSSRRYNGGLVSVHRRPGTRAADLRNAAQYRERDHVIFVFCPSFFLCLLVPVGVPSLRIPGIEFPQNQTSNKFWAHAFSRYRSPAFLETNVFWKTYSFVLCSKNHSTVFHLI